jgi:hypothetical protein
MRFASVLVTAVLFVIPGAAAEDPADSAVFQRIFGVSRIVDAETVAAVLALPVGERLERDTDGDGVTDELWYLDTAKRHNITPLLVRVVDEDGDLAETGRGDLDSDCYYWDHNADGRIDVVTDYQDDDGDDDVDQMGIFYDKNWRDDKDDLTVWWSIDVGDDNRLWYDVNGNYYQQLSQWRTHFSGDELFYQFRLTAEDEKWVNVWEDPFAFYDPDGDECSERVVRISAKGGDIKNLRYSIDADDDAFGSYTHDYDFSITALPPENGLQIPAEESTTLVVRGIETLPVLTWESTGTFAQQAAWGKAMLTWDEVNSNTDGEVDRDPHERWEGILNHASKREDFVQVGGPPASRFNKRVEVTADRGENPPPLTLYYDETDRRFHLSGAAYGYLDIDYNFDGEVDAAYSWTDTDGDGILDQRAADLDADGTVEFTNTLSGSEDSKKYPLEFEALVPDYTQSLDAVLAYSQAFIDVATVALGELPADTQAIIDYYGGPLADYHPETELGHRIQNTPAGARFYTDLVRDRLFVHLESQYGQQLAWVGVSAAYLNGQYAEAAQALGELVDVVPKTGDAPYPLTIKGRTYTKRIAVDFVINDDRTPLYKGSRYGALTKDLKAQRSDFNPRNCVVVDGDYRLTWRVVPHQVDSFGFLGEQLFFIANVPAGEKKTYYIYYQSAGEYTPSYPALTNAVLDNPAYVAWESDAGAYRFYTGQFDFFGKHASRTIPRAERLIYPLVDVSYHTEQDWGIDALHVGKTSGLGGLTVSHGGKDYPVQSPAGEGHVEFEYKVLGSGPVRAGVAIKAKNVFPEAPEKVVELRCFTYAGRAESEIHVRLPEDLDNPSIAIGLMRLEEDAPFTVPGAKAIGTWGRQGDDIGEIGMAVITRRKKCKDVIELDHERRLKCDVSYGNADWTGAHFRYWIIGDWRRGMQYPIAPTAENWEQRVQRLTNEIEAFRDISLRVD